MTYIRGVNRSLRTLVAHESISEVHFRKPATFSGRYRETGWLG